MQLQDRFSWFRSTPGEKGPVVALLCIGFIVLSALPVVFRWAPVPDAFFREYSKLQPVGCLFLTFVLGSLIVLVARLDPEPGSWTTVRHTGFVLIALFDGLEQSWLCPRRCS
jgi:hypothetical protein